MTALETHLRRIIQSNGGFYRDSDVAELAGLDRLRPLLVRCNCGRFTCAAQDVAHFIGLIEETGREWVRDVSLPASDGAYRGDFAQCTPDWPRPPVAPPSAPIKVTVDPSRHVCRFNEADCGGAFDGFSVTSDADPGL